MCTNDLKKWVQTTCVQNDLHPVVLLQLRLLTVTHSTVSTTTSTTSIITSSTVVVVVVLVLLTVLQSY